MKTTTVEGRRRGRPRQGGPGGRADASATPGESEDRDLEADDLESSSDD